MNISTFNTVCRELSLTQRKIAPVTTGGTNTTKSNLKKNLFYNKCKLDQ